MSSQHTGSYSCSHLIYAHALCRWVNLYMHALGPPLKASSTCSSLSFPPLLWVRQAGLCISHFQSLILSPFSSLLLSSALESPLNKPFMWALSHDISICSHLLFLTTLVLQDPAALLVLPPICQQSEMCQGPWTQFIYKPLHTTPATTIGESPLSQ